MNWQQVLSIGLPIIMGIYLLIIAYYFYLEIFSLVLIIKSLIIRLRTKPRQSTPNNLSRITFKQKVRFLFDTSLFFNHTLAVLTTFASIAIIAELPISFRYKLGIIPIIATLLPYIWSFKRATNVGINGGILGVILGLLWLAWRDPNISLLHDSFYFIIINVTANISGWLGGWVGTCQIKEGTVVNLYKILISGDGGCLNQLVVNVQEAVDTVLRSDPISGGDKDLRFIDSRPLMTVAQETPCCSVLSYRHELEWLKKSHPQKIAKSWLRENVYHSPNQIIDYMFNIFQNTVTKVIFIRYPEELDKPENPTGIITLPVEIYLLVLQYKETPSIIWVNPEIEELSSKLSKQIMTIFTPNINQGAKGSIPWSMQQHRMLVIQNWQPKIRLEQYSKNTFGSSIPYQVVSEVQLTDNISLPKPIMDEIVTNPSLLDKFRGKVSTFLAFLIFEASIAFIINMISSYLYDIFR